MPKKTDIYTDLAEINEVASALLYEEMPSFVAEIRRQHKKLDDMYKDDVIKKLVRKYGMKTLKTMMSGKREEFTKEFFSEFFKMTVRNIKAYVKKLKRNAYKNSEEAQIGYAALTLKMLVFNEVSSNLTMEEKLIIKGACVELLDPIQLSQLSRFIDYQRGTKAADKKRMTRFEASDEYLVYSRKQKCLYETQQPKGHSLRSLFMAMLPDPMIKAIEQHPDCKRYIRFETTKGGDYEMSMSRQRREMDYLLMTLRHKSETQFGNMSNAEFFDHEAKRLNKSNPEFIEKEMSRIKNKYLKPE